MFNFTKLKDRILHFLKWCGNHCAEKNLYAILYISIIFYFFGPVILDWAIHGFMFLYVTVLTGVRTNLISEFDALNALLFFIVNYFFFGFVLIVSLGGLFLMFLFFRAGSAYLLTKDPGRDYKKKYNIK